MLMRSAAVIASLVALSTAAHADSKTCRAGALIFGNPDYSGEQRPNPRGQTARQDPPLDWRSLTFGKGKVFLISGLTEEVWGGDVAGVIKLIAGARQPNVPKLVDGPCADARFMNLRGITLAGNDVVVADYLGRAIRRIKDPFGACQVETVAGYRPPTTGTPEPTSGDEDGPVATAKLGRVEWPVSDPAGNIYFIDADAKKVKMISAGAAPVVSAVAPLEPKLLNFTGMTILGGKLYLVGNQSTNAMVVEVDPIAKKARAIREGSDKLFPPVSAQVPALSSITNDGTALIVSGQGYIWRLTKDGKTLTLLAGSGSVLGFPPGYNPAGVYPTDKLVLRFRNDETTSSGSSTSMAWNEGALYWRGRDRTAFVIKIGCP